jgi:hypothetical protein
LFCAPLFGSSLRSSTAESIITLQPEAVGATPKASKRGHSDYSSTSFFSPEARRDSLVSQRSVAHRFENRDSPPSPSPHDPSSLYSPSPTSKMNIRDRLFAPTFPRLKRSLSTPVLGSCPHSTVDDAYTRYSHILHETPKPKKTALQVSQVLGLGPDIVTAVARELGVELA